LEEAEASASGCLARQRRVLFVTRHDEPSSREAINYDDIGDRRVGTLRPSMPAELRDAFTPPTSAAGRVLTAHRERSGTPTEINTQVAFGTLVHVTFEGSTDATIIPTWSPCRFATYHPLRLLWPGSPT